MVMPMQAHILPPQSKGTGTSSVRTSACLTALAAALAAAFVFAPSLFAASTPGGGFAGQSFLIKALRAAFVGYWGSGDHEYPAGLARIVDYWYRYHVAKAAIAALLLIVLVALGVSLWKAFLGAGGISIRSRAALASAAALDMALALFAVAVVMANVQGAVAPFASLLSMLPTRGTSGQYAETLGQVRQQLAGYPRAGDQSPPALTAMVDDFALYHAVLAVTAVIVAAVLIGLSVLSWRKRTQWRTPVPATAQASPETGPEMGPESGPALSGRRTRRLLTTLAVLAALVAASVVVIAVANAGTAADPAPALMASFNGSW
jgi:hypothetical protein